MTTNCYNWCQILRNNQKLRDDFYYTKIILNENEFPIIKTFK